jgi:hypothetical protein
LTVLKTIWACIVVAKCDTHKDLKKTSYCSNNTNTMEGYSNKKRKLNDASVEANNTAEEDYSFKPIRLRSVQADLAAIPYDIVRVNIV